jgi:hypothetical protein
VTAFLALAPGVDAAIAAGIAALAVAWLVWRAVRTFSRKRAGGCGCGPAGAAGGGCSQASQIAQAAKDAARRVAGRTPGA